MLPFLKHLWFNLKNKSIYWISGSFIFVLASLMYVFSPFNGLLNSILLLTVIAFCTVIYNKKILKPHINTIFVALLLSLLSFNLPSFQFYFMLTFSIGITFFTIPYVEHLIPSRRKVLILFLRLLDSLNILQYFRELYINYFDCSDRQSFRNNLIVYSLCFLHILVSKYLFLHRLNLHFFEESLILYILLFFGILGIYLRFLLSCSIVLNGLCWNLALMGELDNNNVPPSSTNPNSTSSNSPNSNLPVNNAAKYSFFERTTHNHHYSNYENAARQGYRFKLWGLGIAGVGTLVGMYAGYQQNVQNRIGEQQNYEFRRQNDLEELAQGIITREEYNKRYPPK